MGCVERSDQKASYHLNAHKTMKFVEDWKFVEGDYFHMLEVAFVNATMMNFQALSSRTANI